MVVVFEYAKFIFHDFLLIGKIIAEEMELYSH
jgi:hypothetical protein